MKRTKEITIITYRRRTVKHRRAVIEPGRRVAKQSTTADSTHVNPGSRSASTVASNTSKDSQSHLNRRQ